MEGRKEGRGDIILKKKGGITLKEQLINDIMQYLAGKLPEEHASDLQLYLYHKLADYDVTEKCTDVAIRDEKVYMDYLYMYLASLRMAGRSEKTIEHYKLQLSMMLHALEKPVGEITTEDLFTYLAQCKAIRQVGNRYLNNKRICFNSFFGWLQKKKHIIYNPASGLDQIHYEKKVKKPYSDEEREILRCACKKERDLALIELLYSTGMRVGELVRLNRQDIHWDTMDCIVFGKGAKEREVYLNASACYHLKKYLMSRTDSNPALFVSSKAPHLRLAEHGVRQVLQRLGIRAGVEKVHPHRFRATAATNALNRGMPVQDVQALLGHEDIGTTMIYCTVARDNVRAAHKRYLSA